MEKPVVVHSMQVGSRKQYTVYVCSVPGGGYAIVQAHESWNDLVKVDPKSKEIDLPGDAAWKLKAPPEGFIMIGCKGVISLYDKNKK